MPPAPPAYLDWNATAPLRPEARAAMLAALEAGGNPSSVHRSGRAARRIVEEARQAVAALAGAAPDNVVFTSGATEAAFLALRGFMVHARAAGKPPPLVSAIEHPAVLQNAGAGPRIPVDSRGIADLAALEARLRAPGPPPAAVALMRVNNETGVIQPVAEAARLCAAAGVPFFCDAVQAAGRLALDFTASGIAALSLSAHKIGGPAGVGALVLAPDAPVAAVTAGGGQERGLRPGTENLAGIAGFGAAARCALGETADTVQAKLRGLRDSMEDRIRTLRPDARIVGGDAPRVANTSCIALAGLAAELQVMALDLEGVMVSAGAACSSGKIRRSPVLAAMGLPDALAACAIRISIGRTTTAAETDRFADSWGKMTAQALRGG